MSITCSCSGLCAVQESYKRATKLLTTNRHQLDILATALLKHETLSLDEMQLVIAGKTVPTQEEKRAAEARKQQKEKEASSSSSKGWFSSWGGSKDTPATDDAQEEAVAKNTPEAKIIGPAPKAKGKEKKWV